MQTLPTAHKLAVLASRSGSYVGGSVASGLKEQCLLRLAQTFGCSSLDGILDTGGAVRGFAAKAGPSDPSHKHNVNTNAKIRHNKQTKAAKQGLKAGSAPKTAAAAPAEEQPQNPAAAQHQGAVLQKLQEKVDSGSSGTRAVGKSEEQKQINSQKDRARIQRQQANEAAVRAARRSAAAASRPGPASPAGPASPPGPATTTASTAAARQPANDSPAPNADQPQSAEPLPWRLQQKQWLAAQPRQPDPASSPGFDLPQNADAQAQALNRVRPGFQQQFQGRRVGLGRYSPVAPNPTPPPAAPQPAALTPQQIQQQDEEMKSFVRRHLYSAKTAAKDLTQNDVNLYYRLNAQSVPEAFPDFYQGTLVEGGGCKALHEEASYTGTSLIQYRESIRLLHLKAESRSQTHVYLDGPTGCGKSIALVSLVDWARSQGWLVLYIPSAQTLIEGGLFHKGEDGLWETPEVAKALLRSMVTNHATDLEKLTSTSGESLLKVAEDGLSASKPGEITAAAASLVSEMSSTDEMPVMIAVDDYNILYSHANYHEWMNEVYRRQLQPHELRLVSALRILEQEAPKNGMFIGAACHGGPVSPKLQVPYPKGTRHTIPKLNFEEATQQLCHYTAQGLVSNTPMYAMQAAYYATDGNAKELRRWQRRLMDMSPSNVTTSMADEHMRWSKALPDDEEVEGGVPPQQEVPQQDLAALPQELKYAEQNDGL